MNSRSKRIALVVLAWWFFLYDPVRYPPPGPWKPQGRYELFESCELDRKAVWRHAKLKPTQRLTWCLWAPAGEMPDPTLEDIHP